MLAILLPCGGGSDIPILAPRVVVGRSPECDVPVNYRSVSARHCELQRVDGYWRVRDLGSSNGTRVNGVATGVSWVLPDDVLVLGKERFYLIYVPPEGSQPPPRVAGSDGGRKPPATATAHRRIAARDWTLGELVPCGGGESVPLLNLVVVVGRLADCDVVLNHGDVSARHCQLDYTVGHWFVNDLGSHNGTRVNNQRCSGTTPLLPNSVLGVARHRFRIVYTPDVEPGDKDEDAFARGLLEKAGIEDWTGDPEEE
jgi:pSer/pThr/pTyr-binding forkhead associated (FHA) protein